MQETIAKHPANGLQTTLEPWKAPFALEKRGPGEPVPLSTTSEPHSIVPEPRGSGVKNECTMLGDLPADPKDTGDDCEASREPTTMP